MTFKVTKQFVRDIETFSAEFNSLTDAQEYISKKSEEDLRQHFKRVYRVYQNDGLLEEFNLDNVGIFLCRPQYAQGEAPLPSSGQAWLVARGDDKKPETQLALFQDKKDAHFFMEIKLLADEKSSATYYLMYAGRTVETLNQKMLHEQNAKSQSQGKGSKVVFHPTPLPTTPRLGPGGYYRTIEDDKKDDEEK